MKVYLALDPDDEIRRIPRVAMQARPFDPEHMSTGHKLRGDVWEYREAELDDETRTKLLRGELTPDEQDELHQRLWTESGPTPFPTEAS